MNTKTLNENKISIFCVWIGEFNFFHRLALKSLANVSRFDVYVIGNNEININDVIFLNIKEVFNHDNRFKIVIDDVIQRPYKLCDLKPWYGEGLFNLSDYISNWWGWSDIDLLISNSINNKIDNIDLSEIKIYGKFGHIMFGHKKAWNISSNLLFNVLESKKKDFFLINKNFALDEMNYLHKILNYLNLKSKIWKKNYLSIGDINPNKFHFYVDNQKFSYFIKEKNDYYGINYTSKVYFDYLHFQRKKLTLCEPNFYHIYIDSNMGIRSYKTLVPFRCIISFYVTLLFQKIKRTDEIISNKYMIDLKTINEKYNNTYS